MELLEAVAKHRAINLLENVRTDGDGQIIRTDSDDEVVVGRMVQFAESQPIRDGRRTALRIGDDVRSLDKALLLQRADGARVPIRPKHCAAESALVHASPDNLKSIAASRRIPGEELGADDLGRVVCNVKKELSGLRVIANDEYREERQVPPRVNAVQVDQWQAS